MYLGKKVFHDLDAYERDRLLNLAVKPSATWLAFFELEGLINKSQLAEQYFGKSQSWISQKINGTVSHNRKQRFTEAEYHQLAEAFRHIAKRLNAHADEIDAAAMETDED